MSASTCKINSVPTSVFWKSWTDVPFGFTSWAHRPLGVMTLSLAYRTGGTWNESDYSAMPAFDALLTEAEGQLDVDAAAQDVFDKIEALLQEDGPIVQPLWRIVRTGYDKRVQGFSMHPTQYIFAEKLVRLSRWLRLVAGRACYRGVDAARGIPRRCSSCSRYRPGTSPPTCSARSPRRSSATCGCSRTATWTRRRYAICAGSAAFVTGDMGHSRIFDVPVAGLVRAAARQHRRSSPGCSSRASFRSRSVWACWPACARGRRTDRVISGLCVVTTSIPPFASTVLVSAVLVFWLGLLARHQHA